MKDITALTIRQLRKVAKILAIKQAESQEERGLASMTAEELINVINACKSATDK